MNFFIIKIIGWICGGKRMVARRFVGLALARFMMMIDRKRYAVTLDNIARSFPEKSNKWHRETANESYRNLGVVFAEIAAFAYIQESDASSLIEYENIELLHKKYLENRGVILLSGHFGNWELLAYSAGYFTKIPITIVVKPQRNVSITQLLHNNRTRSGNLVVDADKAAKTLFKTIKSGGVVALLADQAADAERDIFIDFFGRPAATYEAPAALALRLNTPLIIGFAVRQPTGKYKVRIEEIPHDDLTYSQEGVIELTRRHVAALERAIRENPGQWAWQHRRWKYSPKENNIRNKGDAR